MGKGKGKCCRLHSRRSTHEGALRAPCEFAQGGPKHMMIRCRSCIGGNASWVGVATLFV